MPFTGAVWFDDLENQARPAARPAPRRLVNEEPPPFTPFIGTGLPATALAFEEPPRSRPIAPRPYRPLWQEPLREFAGVTDVTVSLAWQEPPGRLLPRAPARRFDGPDDAGFAAPFLPPPPPAETPSSLPRRPPFRPPAAPEEGFAFVLPPPPPGREALDPPPAGPRRPPARRLQLAEDPGVAPVPDDRTTFPADPVPFARRVVAPPRRSAGTEEPPSTAAAPDYLLWLAGADAAPAHLPRVRPWRQATAEDDAALAQLEAYAASSLFAPAWAEAPPARRTRPPARPAPWADPGPTLDAAQTAGGGAGAGGPWIEDAPLLWRYAAPRRGRAWEPPAEPWLAVAYTAPPGTAPGPGQAKPPALVVIPGPYYVSAGAIYCAGAVIGDVGSE